MHLPERILFYKVHETSESFESAVNSLKKRNGGQVMRRLGRRRLLRMTTPLSPLVISARGRKHFSLAALFLFRLINHGLRTCGPTLRSGIGGEPMELGLLLCSKANLALLLNGYCRGITHIASNQKVECALGERAPAGRDQGSACLAALLAGFF